MVVSEKCIKSMYAQKKHKNLISMYSKYVSAKIVNKAIRTYLIVSHIFKQLSINMKQLETD